MNYNKFNFFIIFSLVLIFGQVLTEDNISADQKTLLVGLTNDENNSEELNKKNKNENNVIRPTEFVERGLVGDIEKLIKVAEILQTVGQKVIPAILNTNLGSAAIETETDLTPTAFGSKGIHDGLFHIHELKKNVDILKNKK